VSRTWIAAAALGLALAACATPDADVHTLALVLVNDDPGCLAAQVATVRSVLVEAVGQDETGASCRLDARCLDTDVAASLEELEAQLREAPPPVLDVEADRVVRLRVLGYQEGGCAIAPNMCGSADPVGEATRLEVPVTCDLGDTIQRCQVQMYAPCAP
jgi:hypothetical protein